jgi:hypothetical protein
MLFLLVLPLTFAGESAFSFGVQAAVSKDLSDRLRREESAVLGAGPAVVFTARAAVRPPRFAAPDPLGGVDLRLAWESESSSGTNRVNWTESGWRFYDDAQPVRIWSNRLLLGPEVRIPVPGDPPLQPYVGASAGGGRLRATQSLTGEAAVLADSSAEGAASTRQWIAAAGAHGGLRYSVPETRTGSDRLLVELEVGYTVSFIAPAPLQEADVSFDPHRAGFGWNPLRVGLGLSLPL